MAEGTCVFHGDCSSKVAEHDRRIRDLEMHCKEMDGDVESLKHIGDTRERRFTEWCAGLDKNQKDSDNRWDDRMLKFEQKLANHLPPWATMAIALLTGICGWALGR